MGCTTGAGGDAVTAGDGGAAITGAGAGAGGVDDNLTMNEFGGGGEAPVRECAGFTGTIDREFSGAVGVTAGGFSALETITGGESDSVGAEEESSKVGADGGLADDDEESWTTSLPDVGTNTAEFAFDVAGDTAAIGTAGAGEA